MAARTATRIAELRQQLRDLAPSVCGLFISLRPRRFTTVILTLRLIDPNDYTVHEDGQLIGRIRLARDRPPPDVVMERDGDDPRPAVRRRSDYRRRQGAVQNGWLAFKQKHGPEKLARAYAEMNVANRAYRYGRR